jgi:hypothetical protein
MAGSVDSGPWRTRRETGDSKRGVRNDSQRGIHNDSLMRVLLKAVHDSRHFKNDSRHFKSTGSNEHNSSLVEVERQAHGLCSEPIIVFNQ